MQDRFSIPTTRWRCPRYVQIIAQRSSLSPNTPPFLTRGRRKAGFRSVVLVISTGCTCKRRGCKLGRYPDGASRPLARLRSGRENPMPKTLIVCCDGT